MASNRGRSTQICSICKKSFSSRGTLSSGRAMVGQPSGGLNCSDGESDVEETPAKPFCANCKPGATIRIRPPLPTSSPPGAHQELKKTEIYCKYCIHAPVLAAKTCLQCEVSLCDDHLRVLCNSEDHILIPPTSSIKERMCPDHKKVRKYFCCEDDICVCVDCCHTGEHKGHQTKTLKEAFEKEKRNLRILLEQLAATRVETENRRRSLQERWEKEKDKVAGEMERVTALFRDIRRQLEDLEKRLLSEISRQEEQISQSVSDLIQQLEIQKDELSKKMRHIEELCDTADPLTLGGSKSLTDDVSEYVDQSEMVWQTVKNTFPSFMGTVHGLVSVTVHRRLTDIITQTPELKGFFLEEVSNIKLDEKTSAWDLQISADQKMASWRSAKPLKPRRSMRKKNKQMFESSQVLSTRSFSSGRHYWEVETGQEGGVRIGVTYANVIRKGMQFHVGENKNSWCLRIWYKNYSAIYNQQTVQLNQKVESNRVGVFLDYRAGQLSFFEVDNTIRHLHTFTATFTEPLYAVFWVYHNWVKVIS